MLFPLAVLSSIPTADLPDPTPGLFLDGGGLPNALGAYSVARKMRAAYTGPAFRVQRISDNTQTNIGFDVNNDLNVAALDTFCSGTTGFVAKIYDQMGTWNGTDGTSGKDLLQATLANMWRVYASGSVENPVGGTKPCIRATNAARAMVTAPFTRVHSTWAVAAAYVGAITGETTTYSPRSFSVLPTSTNLGDTDPPGSIVIGRNAANEKWGINRSGTWTTTVDGTYGQLSQVVASINNDTYSLTVDGARVVGTNQVITELDYTRFAIGHRGYGIQSSTDQLFSELIVFPTSLTQAQSDYLASNQKTYYDTGEPPITPPDPTTLDWAGLDYTNLFTEEFDTGYTRNITGPVSYTQTSSTTTYTNTVNPTHWGIYGPPPYITGTTTPKKNGNEGIGYRYPSQIKVDTVKDECTILGLGDYSGGMSKRNVDGSTRRYGGWEITWYVDPGPGYGPAILLWPNSANWPDDGEVDIVELPKGVIGGVGTMHTTLHIGKGNKTTGKTLKGDWTKPHVSACIWEAGFFKFYMDGELYWTCTDLSFQPPGPMWLGIQHDVGGFYANGSQGWIAVRNASTPQPSKLHIPRIRIFRKD